MNNQMIDLIADLQDKLEKLNENFYLEFRKINAELQYMRMSLQKEQDQVLDAMEAEQKSKSEAKI